MKMNKKIIRIGSIGLILVGIGAGIVFGKQYIDYKKRLNEYDAELEQYKVGTEEGYARQAKEESLASNFVDSMIEALEEFEPETVIEDGEADAEKQIIYKDKEGKTYTEEEILSKWFDTSEDKNYLMGKDGTIYTPEYASGKLLCVLSVPTAGIRRGVYTGTVEDITHDLEIWMVTVANTDMVPGKTPMTILGHNHPSQDLSFNNLGSVQIGDHFYIYSTTGIFEYETTDIFIMGRETVMQQLGADLTRPKEKCYIVTCGRDWMTVNGVSSRYQDFVVEGNLTRKMTLSEYKEALEENPDLTL